MFDKIVERGFFSERDGAALAANIVKGVAYTHSKRVLHRDLKPENLLCVTADSNNLTDVKIADFGLSVRLGPNEMAAGMLGSPSYIAPEILLKQPYDFKADMWSVGVIVYILLGGYPPFIEENGIPLKKAIIERRFEFHEDEWADVSETAKDFIRKLLTIDPNKRLSSQEALQHDFIAGSHTASNEHRGRALANIKHFNAKRRFRGMALAIITSNRIRNLAKKVKQQLAKEGKSNPATPNVSDSIQFLHGKLIELASRRRNLLKELQMIDDEEMNLNAQITRLICE